MSDALAKLKRCFELLGKIKDEDRPNVIVYLPEGLLFSYKGRAALSQWMPGYGPVGGMKLQRGDILDFFTRLELIINWVFIKHFVVEPDRISAYEQMLDRIDLFSKISLLADWGLIDSRMKSNLICLKEVRNAFAHRWDGNEARYKNRQIIENFGQFKNDAEESFVNMVRLYNGGDVNLDELTEKLLTAAK